MNKYIKTCLLIFLTSFAVGSFALAQEDGLENSEKKLDYGKEIIVDSDLDGLTDLGEEELFNTDPLNPDSDGDGFYDGAEIIEETDPLDNTSPVALKIISTNIVPTERETPWAWYISRASGLIAFLLLYLVMFLGLSIRTPILKNILKPIYSLKIHAWLSVHSLFFVFLHGGVLIFDKFINVRIMDVFIPFSSEVYKNEITLGIIGMYIMILLILTSYFRKRISNRMWRITHYLNIILYIIVIGHSLELGTDLQEGLARSIFVYANQFLALIIIINVFTRIFNYIKNKILRSKNNENLRESYSEIFHKRD